MDESRLGPVFDGVPQIRREDIYTRHNEALGAIAVAVCQDLVAQKSDVAPLYLLVTDHHKNTGNYKDNNEVWIMASQGFSGGAFSQLCRIDVVGTTVDLYIRQHKSLAPEAPFP